jgi:antitoxin VapB
VKTAKLFRNGRSQGIRLPREFRFEGDHVFLERVGNGVLILPSKKGWDTLIRSLGQFSGDFMAERSQPERQNRPEVF